MQEEAPATVDQLVEELEDAVSKDNNYEPDAQGLGGGTEWEKLAVALSPLQREALLTLLNEDGMLALNKLAAANGTISELLINEINEIAMDILGDLLIAGEELTEEYIPMLRNI